MPSVDPISIRSVSTSVLSSPHQRSQLTLGGAFHSAKQYAERGSNQHSVSTSVRSSTAPTLSANPRRRLSLSQTICRAWIQSAFRQYFGTVINSTNAHRNPSAAPFTQPNDMPSVDRISIPSVSTSVLSSTAPTLTAIHRRRLSLGQTICRAWIQSAFLPSVLRYCHQQHQRSPQSIGGAYHSVKRYAERGSNQHSFRQYFV